MSVPEHPPVTTVWLASQEAVTWEIPPASTVTVLVCTFRKVTVPVPDGPVGPDGPVSPVEPIGPVGPMLPVGPVGPADPCRPCAPVGPTAPVAPTAPAAPVAPARLTPGVGHALDALGPYRVVAVLSK